VYPLDKTVSTMFCILYDEKLYGKEKQLGDFGGDAYLYSEKNSKYMDNTIDKSTNVLFLFTVLREEYINNEDVIQFSFLDTYRNNTHKTIMSYDWVVSNCSSSTFVLFVDDDFYVNIPNILQFVSFMSATTNPTWLANFIFNSCATKPTYTSSMNIAFINGNAIWSLRTTLV
jgi:hypothetical protein